VNESGGVNAEVRSGRLEAVYVLETPLDPAKVAEVLAGEQSSGTFVRVAGESDELRQRSRATIQCSSSPLFGTKIFSPWSIGWPIGNTW